MRTLLNWIARRMRPADKVESTLNIAPKAERAFAQSVLVVKRVWVDKNECTSKTLCEAESEGLIKNSEEHHGAAVVQEHMLRRTQEELKLLLGTSSVCAMAALYLETADGRVLNLDDDAVQQALKAGTYRWA